MLRAVVDPGVLISALISPTGAPAELIRRWLSGAVQLVWSPTLLEEFETVCQRPRFRQWFTIDEAAAVARLIQEAGEQRNDAPGFAHPPPDDGDRYLVDLSLSTQVDCLVTGDAALLGHRVPGVRVVTPRKLVHVLDEIEQRSDSSRLPDSAQ